MILFPSYAKSHSKQPPVGPANALDEGETAGAGDAEYWRKQWERYEDDRAIVDVDVRGWLFTPQKGPLSRKHRLMVALARQLAGIPAPTNKASPSSSVSSSRQSSPTRRQSTVQEDQLVAQQAEAIIEKGEAEAEIANRGGFSERPRDDSDSTSIYDDAETPPGLPPRRQNTPQISPGAVSGGRPMTAAELAVANNNLMTRLKPFMASALTGSAINVFFYNETMSRQKTVMTDPYGHFSFRASLEFLPTHVRVLASEDLSIQEEVKIVASKGVSLISDVDDTVRHSAITKGAREIFRNAFVRDMSELTVAGVKEWYKKLADMGVQLHYVSNSPWQLFPALTNYFAVAELPQGSFHLKQYSGMLQGIFEPVAERKKATLERLLRDFPERKFILVGDSGEADLEVYTDVVIEHPGRVLGVFIRDVTSPPSKSFFDPSMGPLSGENTPNGRHSRNPSVDTPNLLGSHQPSTQQTDSAFPYTASPRSMSLASQSSWTQADARGMHSTGRSPTRGTFPPPGSVSQRRTNLNGSSTSWDGQEIIDAYQGQPVNKREEMWKRRWRRAKDIMDRHGVMLRTWRVGSDVMEECVRVVDKELEHMTGDRSKDGPAKWRR
ncbi:hypothetical protein ANO11243_058040 [Dothideomycetidae sp. 11243]|nr:hypothetical protein ANO11243_058040 [fungal sp. No.11243]